MKTQVIGKNIFTDQKIIKVKYESHEIDHILVHKSRDVYFGNPLSNIALGWVYTKDDMPSEKEMTKFKRLSDSCTVTGFWSTTSGAKYVFQNVLANPNINKLVVFSEKRDNSHFLIDALIRFWESGTDIKGIIRNTMASNPRFDGMTIEELERVRTQADLLVVRNISSLDEIDIVVKQCYQEPENALTAEELNEKIDGEIEFFTKGIRHIFDDGARFEKPYIKKSTEQGTFIVITGSDGSGKATQSKLTVKKLNEMNNESVYLTFPDYDGFFGTMVGKYLNGDYGDVHEISPYLSSMLYASDRWENKTKIEDALAENRIVICDRYAESSIGHQAIKIKDDSKREEFITWLNRLEFDVFKIPKPKFTIFLYVPYEYTSKLVEKKEQRDYIHNGTNKDGHENNQDHQESAIDMFVKQAKERDDWFLVDCVKDGNLLSIEEINEKIIDILKGEKII